MRTPARLAVLVAPAMLAALAACADADAPDSVAAEGASLIYGNDDRRDYYQLTSPAHITLADATAMVLSNGDLAASNGGWQVDVSTSFAAYYDLCPTEPYASQPAPGWCTAFRVGPDLVATAGHCITTSGECQGTSFVFGFRMDSASTVRSWVTNDDVYRCVQIIARAETATDDWAVIRVDRTIVGKPTLAVRRSGKVVDGAPLVLSGHPAGLPLKVAANASVRANAHANYFEANVDAYGGNSGSPIVNATTGLVEGVLVRGNDDFVYNRKAKCYTSNKCFDSGCPTWEEATRTTRFASWIPCTSDAGCNDGDPCNGDETCVGGTCHAGVSVDCSDGSVCTTDACVVSGGAAMCTSTTLSCNDGNACTVDACDPVTGCSSTPIVCGAGQVCLGGACTTCAPRGATCSADAECCSASCNTKKKKCN